jgi:hypothetical protein
LTSEVAKCRDPRHECGHVVEPQGGGLRDWQVNTRRLEEGVNTPSTSYVSRIREIRARELDIETCEVARSKNARRKVNIASRGFVKGRCQGWT